MGASNSKKSEQIVTAADQTLTSSASTTSQTLQNVTISTNAPATLVSAPSTQQGNLTFVTISSVKPVDGTITYVKGKVTAPDGVKVDVQPSAPTIEQLSTLKNGVFFVADSTKDSVNLVFLNGHLQNANGSAVIAPIALENTVSFAATLASVVDKWTQIGSPVQAGIGSTTFNFLFPIPKDTHWVVDNAADAALTSSSFSSSVQPEHRPIGKKLTRQQKKMQEAAALHHLWER